MSQINDDLRVVGTVSATGLSLSSPSVTNAMCSANMDLVRSKLDQDAMARFTVPWHSLYIHDDFLTPLTDTPGTDDLGIIDPGFGSGSVYVSAGDCKGLGATTRYARFLYPVPAEYDDGQSLGLIFSAGMVTNAADVSCVVDVEAYVSDAVTGVGSEICSTAATDINNLVFAEKTFYLTETGLVSGDLIDFRVAITCNDAATGTAVTPVIGQIDFACDIKG